MINPRNSFVITRIIRIETTIIHIIKQIILLTLLNAIIVVVMAIWQEIVKSH